MAWPGCGEFDVNDAFVPLAHSACLLGAPRLQTPLYRFPVFGLRAVAIPAVATGMAREALQHLTEEASRSAPQAGTRPQSARATVQDTVACAEAQLQAAQQQRQVWRALRPSSAAASRAAPARRGRG